MHKSRLFLHKVHYYIKMYISLHIKWTVVRDSNEECETVCAVHNILHSISFFLFRFLLNFKMPPEIHNGQEERDGDGGQEKKTQV